MRVGGGVGGRWGVGVRWGSGKVCGGVGGYVGEWEGRWGSGGRRG